MTGIVKTYVTFGTDHDDLHPNVGVKVSEGYVVIEAPTREQGRDIAFVILGTKWAFDYGTEHFADSIARGLYPAGELLRVGWLNFDRQKKIVLAVEDTWEKAEGGSNDEEIESLQEARDLLADIIDYTPSDERDWGEPAPLETTRSQSGEW